MAHPLLPLLFEVRILVLLPSLGDGYHLTGAGIEVLNVDVRVSVDVDIGIEKHQLSDGFSLLGDPTQEPLGDLWACGLLILVGGGLGALLILKDAADISELRPVSGHGLDKPGDHLNVLLGTSDKLLEVLWVILQTIVEHLFVKADGRQLRQVLLSCIHWILIGHLVEEDGLVGMRLLVSVGLLHVREMCGTDYAHG